MKYKVNLNAKNSKYTPKRVNFPSKISPVSGMFFVKNAATSKPTNINKHARFKKYSKKVSGRAEKKSTPFKVALRKALYIFLGFAFFVAMVSVIGFAMYLKTLESSLPDPDKLIDRNSQLSTQIFDRNGKLLYTFYGEENREFIPLDQIPEKTKMALLAAEDVSFYEHKGLDLAGVARAGLQYLKIIPGQSGASTITQQLVRNTILMDEYGVGAFERTLTRKIREMLFTMQVDQTLTKDEILQMYMNEVFMGGVTYGYQSAAKSYFGKDAKNLTLAESALLAGLIQAPSVYNPLNGTEPEMAKVRQEYVLDQMLKHSNITGVTEEEIVAAKAEKMVYKSANLDIKAPHFVFYVKEELEKLYGPDKVVHGGLRVKTTLDYSIQKIAEEEIKNGIKKYGKPLNVNNGAMVAIDPKTGDILAMVGSVDYNSKNPKIDGNVNVTMALRQMGSSVKPYTYLTAFNQGYGPWLLTPDIKGMSFGAYKLVNWDTKYYGLMVARQALIQSRNIPAVYTVQLVGVDNFIKTAETFGITTLTDRSKYGLSITLGAAEMKLLEHTAAFTIFANGGIKRDARAILEVKDSDGNVLLENKENKGTRVWDEKEIYMINWILCDLGGFGDQPMNNNYLLNGKRTFCGKTGTTDGPRDLTAMMYTKSLVVGFWTGNNDNTETPGAWSTTVPLPIAGSFMTRMASKYKPEPFVRPSGISAGTVCTDTGMSASKTSSCKKTPTIYITGKAPKEDSRDSLYICKANGKIATNESFARAYGLGTTKYLMNKKLENELQQTHYEKYLSSYKGGIYLFTRPEEAECELPLGPSNAPTVQIYSPSKNETVYPGSSINVAAYASALGGVKKIEFSFDATLIETVTSSPFSFNYTIPGGTSVGTHTITAIVYDNDSRTGSSIINVEVVAGALSVNITFPISGATVSSIPYTFTASTAGGVTRVDFVITGPGSYSKVITDSTSSDGWSVSFDDSSVANGNYQVYAKGYKSSATVNSSAVNFDISR